MKSYEDECNQPYRSTRFNQKCVCVAIARWLVKLEFQDSKKDGWYHCQEIKKVPESQKNVIDITDIIR